MPLELPHILHSTCNFDLHEHITYYCLCFLSRHALSTDCDLSKAPRRRTDGAIVLDSEFYTVKLYTSDGGVKLISRKNGSVERQIRINLGQVPIGYR